MELYIKDVAGKEVTVGTRVAFIVPQFRFLKVGIVDAVTPRGVKILYDGHWVTHRKRNQISRIEV